MNYSYAYQKSECGCTKEMSMFWPPRHRYEGKSPGGTKNQFCPMFFHILPIWEYGIQNHICIHDDEWKCRHKNISIILRIIDKQTNKTLKIVRYTNCIAKGRRPKHAEEFMIVDNSILLKNTNIIIYTQLQPCHHSGGKDGTYDERSCTELILDWYKTKLKPFNIDLSFQCGSLYKAMWVDPPSKYNKPGCDMYKSTAENARIGIKLLYENGIDVTMIQDWSFLKSLTSDQIIIPEEKIKIKHYVDLKLGQLLQTIRDGSFWKNSNKLS